MIEKSFTRLRNYCEAENYKGWDPYDGLNSAIFQVTPFKRWDIARLVLIQLCKRSPVNLRPLLMVPKQHNAKGVGLFLNGYCKLYRLAVQGDTRFGTVEELRGKIDEVAQLLLTLQSPGYSGACWGYNFDWQARRLFLFPAHTPTVVATTFCASALFEAYEITGNRLYLDTALSSAEFVLKDLHRSEHKGGFMLSYSPLPGNDTVYNASLLGAKLLSYCYHYTGNEEYKTVARQIVNAACEGQAKDGSWVYGLLPVQSWIDSFHTGYNLDAISHYTRLCEDSAYKVHLDKGLKFYLENFFLPDGTPKYYHNKTYPIDIHCPGQLWVVLSEMRRWQGNSALCDSVARWTITNMQSPKGYFYYQLKKGVSSKISYMRWSNAFMFNALSHYLLESHGE
jgi:hypothetical protein